MPILQVHADYQWQLATDAHVIIIIIIKLPN
jgi:hypothetical protein